MKTLSQTSQTRFQSNENLLRVMILYLSVKDIACLSQVSKFFHKTTRHFDFQFKEVSHEFFCSQYENYSLDNQLNESSILSSNNINSVKGSRNSSDQEEIVFHIQSPSPSLFTWKQLLNIGMNIKQSWLSNPHQAKYINDLALVSQYLYSNLKECEILPRLRKPNHIIEGDFNSSLQTYLYDFIYEQQDLYEEYNHKMGEFLSYNKPIQSRRPEVPFCDFINRFKQLKDSIDTPDKIDVLNQLRWYMCFNIEDSLISKKEKDNSLRQKIIIDWQINNDNNSFYNYSNGDNVEEDCDSIFDNIVLEKEQETNVNQVLHNISNYNLSKDELILNNDVINRLLQQETNPLFFVIRSICFTISFYCQYSMNYISSTFTKDTDVLGEYIKIYKNYIDTAIGMNEYCENINVALNYCYETICKDSPSTPKFSIFRMFSIVWNKELSKQLSNHQSMLSKVKQSIISLYANSINEFADILKVKLKGNNSKNKDNYDDISIGESFSTKYCSNINESYNPLFTMSNDDGFGSESGLKIDESLSNNLIEQGLGVITDTFCHEFNVFSLNSSQIKVNRHFNEIEDQILDIVESMISSVYEPNKQREESAWIKILIDDIIKYFSSCFYSSRILTQLKLRLYDRIYSCIKAKVTPDLINDFKNYIINKKIAITKEFKAKTYFELHPNTFKTDALYETLFNSISTQVIPQLVKEYCVVRYIIETGKAQGSILVGLKQLEDWICEKREKGFYKNKQIEKELKRKNIQCEFSEYEQEMLSMSWMPSLETIAKAKEMNVLKKTYCGLTDKGLNTHSTYFNVNINASDNASDNYLDRDDFAVALELV